MIYSSSWVFTSGEIWAGCCVGFCHWRIKFFELMFLEQMSWLVEDVIWLEVEGLWYFFNWTIRWWTWIKVEFLFTTIEEPLASII